MKKYLIIFAALALASCTQYLEETPLSPVIVDNPAIAVSNVKDSSFTVTFTPAAGTGFYSYAVLKGAPAELDATTLFKVKVSKTLKAATVDYAKNPTTSIDLKNLAPNSTYTAYVVSASEQGNIGDVISQVVMTSDGVAPTFNVKSPKYSDEVFTFSFDESVKYVDGMAFNVRYYDAENVAEDKECGTAKVEDVTVDGSKVTVVLDSIPSGAYVSLSYPQGTFTDIAGNDCAAVESVYATTEKGSLYSTGITGRQANATFPISIYGGEDVVLVTNLSNPIWISVPETAEIADYDTSLEGSITYEGDGYKMEYLTGSQHSTTGYTFDYGWNSRYNCALCYPNVSYYSGRPDPAKGDMVTIVIPAGFLTDKYGNTSDALTIGPFLYSYGYKISDFTGTYQYKAKSYRKGTITESPIVVAPDPKSEDGKDLLIYGFGVTSPYINLFGDMVDYSPISARVDFDYGTVTIPEQIFGQCTSEDYPFYWACAGYNTDDYSVPFTVAKAGEWVLDDIQLMEYYKVNSSGKLAYAGYVDYYSSGTMTRTSTEYTIPSAQSAQGYLYFEAPSKRSDKVSDLR